MSRLLLSTGLLLLGSDSSAVVYSVETTTEFSTALAAAGPGDTISLQPGVYDGGHYRAGLTGVTIRGNTGDPRTPEEIVFRGGVNGLQLSDANGVTLEGLTFEQQTGNGLNIDDGGTFATPSTDITLRGVTVRDMAATGNNDGIKLSGVTGFLLDGVRVDDWGPGGSAVDPVGSHHGVIRYSHFRSETLTDNGSVVRPKGGSKDIAVYGNLIELPTGAGRALQAGGSTGAEFFRFVDGDSGYEAADIRFYGNRVVGGSSAMNWVNIDGGAFHHNDVRGPTRWAMRILNENPGAAIVDTTGGVFMDNYVEFDGDAWSRAVNVGAETDAASFTFARNKWFNTANPTPAGSTPSLPAPEIDGEYGGAAPWTAGEPMRWQLDWGEWIVPVGVEDAIVPIENYGDYLRVDAYAYSDLDPLAGEPFTGDVWGSPAPSEVETDRLRGLVLVRPSACPSCQTGVVGDYDYNDVLNTKDHFHWANAYGYEGQAPLADGNGDGVVNAADYTVWRDAYAAAQNPVAVPEPATLTLVALAFFSASGRRLG